MLAPAGQATARAGQLCWLAALVARRQAPRTPAVVNFRLFVGAAYMRPANLPPHPVFPSPPCRGRACPARNLPLNPFYGLIRRGGIHPSRTPSRCRKPPRRPEDWPPYNPTYPLPTTQKRTHNRKGHASFIFMPAFLWLYQAGGLPLSARRQAQSWPPDTPGTSRPAAN